MFRRIREAAVIIIVILFSSCSYPDEDIITLILPSYLPIVDISGESPYMDLYVFDGEKCYHRFIRSGQSEITVPVRKGVLALFTLKPYGKYSTVSSYMEPGMDGPVLFFPEASQLIEFYTDLAVHNPALIANTSISSLLEICPEPDRLDKMKILSYLETGDEEDPVVPDLSGELFEIGIDTYIPGLWRSDRADMSDFLVSHNTEKLVLDLHEGVYHYFHEDGMHHLMIVVTGDGKHSSRLDYTVW